MYCARPNRPLTKSQRAFNRLVTTVEQLRARLENETRRLDKALAYFGENLYPRLQRLNVVRKDLVRALACFLGGKQLKKKKDLATLRTILS